MSNVVLKLITLIIRYINRLVCLLIYYFLLIVWMTFIQHSIRSHHPSSTNLRNTSCITISLMVLPMCYCRRWYNILICLIASITINSIEIWTLPRILNRIQLTKIVDIITSWILIWAHHLLGRFVLATCTATNIIFSLVIINCPEIFWTCHTTWTLCSSRETSAFAHVSFISCCLCLWVQTNVLV